MAQEDHQEVTTASENDIATKALAFLRSGNYEAVKQAIIYLETRSGQLQTDAFANLRDVLDHLVAAVQPGISEDELSQQIAETNEHLRRAVMHPFQDIIEERLAKLTRKKRLYIIRQEVFKDVLSEREFLRRLDGAKNLLVEIRLRKGDGRSTDLAETIALLQRCFDELEDLGQEIKPNSKALAVRAIIFLLVTTFGAVVALLLEHFFAH